mgnify:CR=1 FL=1|jgi:hypothetical protein
MHFDFGRGSLVRGKRRCRQRASRQPAELPWRSHEELAAHLVSPTRGEPDEALRTGVARVTRSRLRGGSPVRILLRRAPRPGRAGKGNWPIGAPRGRSLPTVAVLRRRRIASPASPSIGGTFKCWPQPAPSVRRVLLLRGDLGQHLLAAALTRNFSVRRKRARNSGLMKLGWSPEKWCGGFCAHWFSRQASGALLAEARKFNFQN